MSADKKTSGKPDKLFAGKAGPGRPKGCRNKTTLIAKEAIATAAERLGGVDRLVRWAKEDDKNESTFWGTIYPKLLPLQLTGEGGGAIKVDHAYREEAKRQITELFGPTPHLIEHG